MKLRLSIAVATMIAAPSVFGSVEWEIPQQGRSSVEIEETVGSVVIKPQKGNISLGLSYIGMKNDYREYDPNNVLVDSEVAGLGSIRGLIGSMEYRFPEANGRYDSIHLSLFHMKGNTDYVGQMLFSGEGYGSVVANSKNTYRQLEGLYRFNLVNSGGSKYYVGGGLGYHYWDRKMSATQDEVYDWLYLKVNMGALWQINNNLKIGLEGGYVSAMSPTMVAKIESTEIKFDLEGVYSIDLGVPLVYTISPSWDMTMEVRYERYNIDDSVASGEFYEPRSTTKNIYTKVGMNYKF